MKGFKVVAVEGLDGSAKTTICNELKSKLTQAGYRVIDTREPGGCLESEYLRDTLKNQTGSTHSWSPVSQMLLMFASRVESAVKLKQWSLTEVPLMRDELTAKDFSTVDVDKGVGKVTEEVADKTIFLLDRNFLSSWVYQVVGQGADEALYHQLLGTYLQDGFLPTVTIICHSSSEDLEGELARRGEELDILDKLALENRSKFERTYRSIKSSPTNGKVFHIENDTFNWPTIGLKFSQSLQYQQILEQLK